MDGFQWYCDKCNYLLFETFIKLKNIVTQLPPIFDSFWENKEYRTCKKCNEYLKRP